MKTTRTLEMEEALYEYFFLQKSMRVAMEVQVPYAGRVDFLAIKGKEVIFVEIKQSKADFKSKNGHNFFGTKNYYIVPKDLVSSIIDLVEPHVGLLTYYEKYSDRMQVDIVKNAKTMKVPYGEKYIEQLSHNLLTASNSNTRRLLFNRRIERKRNSKVG